MYFTQETNDVVIRQQESLLHDPIDLPFQTDITTTARMNIG